MAVRKLTPYFQGLQSAARLDRFAPKIGNLPTGALLRPHYLSTAWRLLSIRASLGCRQAVDAGLWLLETARKWHVRTRVEGRFWEQGIRMCLHILRRVGAQRESEINERSTAALERGLREAEEEFIRTLRRRIYARRKAIVEPVFGQIKGRGFRQFLLRGEKKVRGEWSLICTTHNLRKLYGRMCGRWTNN